MLLARALAFRTFIHVASHYEPEPRSFVGVGGVRLQADAWSGDGGEQLPAVLMLHGGGQTRHSWKSTGAELAACGFDVVALDARGHGESDWSADAQYDIETLSRDVLDVIKALDRPVVLVGASLGGLTSLIAATQAGPEQVAAVVLVDIVPRFEASGSSRIREFMLGGLAGFESLDDASAAIAAYLPHRKRPRSTDGLRRNLRQGPDNRWYWHWDPAFMSRSEDDPSRAVEQFEVAVGSIDVPLLLLHGAQSDVVSAEGIARFRELAPQARVVDLPNAAHTAAGDDNEAFSAAVVAFVASALSTA
jgi:pimeloyl-ACP methyl ester carboxylesterase